MGIPNSDLVIPLIIIAVCLLIVWFTYRLTRRHSDGWELEDLDPSAGVNETLIDIDAIEAWRRDHGSVVTAWIDSHETGLESLSSSGLQLDLTSKPLGVDDDLTTSMRQAITAHPTPAMRAQLSAMMVAAEATVVAVRRSDYPTAERQHLTYIDYRDQWLHRLRQPSPDGQQLDIGAAEAHRHSGDRVLRPVPDIDTDSASLEPSPDQVQGAPHDEFGDPAPDASQGAIVAELNPGGSHEDVDEWQITRPRRSRRKRRRAG